MITSKTWLRVGLCSVFFATASYGTEFFLLPVGASGPHTIVGNQITLDGPGQIITFEIRMDNWDPVPDVGACSDGSICSISLQDCPFGSCVGSSGLLGAYQARIDAAGYAGVLSPVPPPLIDTTHPDFVFSGIPGILVAIDTSSDSWAYGGLVFNPAQAVPYTGVDKYGGTLDVDVPLGGAGEYTIGFVNNPLDTFANDGGGTPIVPLSTTPALVTVLCQFAADCNDGDDCTDDVCNPDQTCSHTPNFDQQAFCCNPAGGALIPLDDGNDCTDNICLPDGTVDHPPSPAGSNCNGSPVGTCDAQDTCDGGGFCIANSQPAGTACGNGANTDCTNPDTCNGSGTCLPNHESAGTACGDPSSTECTNPDTCNGSGSCSVNHAANGTPCDDGLFCTVNEACSAGACGGGAFACNDGVGCTDDSCDEVLDQCFNDINDQNCDNGQFCDGVEICDPVLDCVIAPGTVPDCDDLVGCTDDFCNEAMDQCVNQANDQNCDNGLFCDGAETCDSLLDCMPGTAPDCDDLIDCTTDSCDEGNDTCAHAPVDALCPDDGLFCNGTEFCSVAIGCDSSGSPCGGPCDEVQDICLCDAPLAAGVGPRYISVSPQPAGSGPQAIMITPDCPGGVPMFVSAPEPFNLAGPQNQAMLGRLTTTPVFLTPAEWGGTVYVVGADLSPGTTFVVHGDCGSPGNPGLSDPASATTLLWADVNDDSVTNLADVLFIILGFQGNFGQSNLAQLDLWGTGAGDPCEPEQVLNIADVLRAVLAFQGNSYSQTGCTIACP